MIVKGAMFTWFLIRTERFTTLELQVNYIAEFLNIKYDGFSKKYNCTDLIFYECFNNIESAIAKEKQMKKWKRSWKEIVIIKPNPSMVDLFNSVKEY